MGNRIEPPAIEHAEGSSRVLAVLCDLLLIIVLCIPCAIPVHYFALKNLSVSDTPELIGFLLISFSIPVLAIILFWAINFPLIHKYGQTVGKRLLYIKIVRSNGTPASVWRIFFIRYLLVFLLWLTIFIISCETLPFICIFLVLPPVLPAFIILAHVFPIFSKSYRCLHDVFAGTIVVKA